MAEYIPGGHYDPHASTLPAPPEAVGNIVTPALSFPRLSPAEHGASKDPNRPTMPAESQALLNWPAMLSLALGITAFIGLGPIGSVFAVVLGHSGLRYGSRIRVGERQAGWGLALGYVGLVVWALLLSIFWGSVMSAIQELGRYERLIGV